MVRRVAIALWLLVAAAALLFGSISVRRDSVAMVPAGTPAALSELGRDAFGRNCASCHACKEVAIREQDASRLLQRLASHGRGGLADDLAVVAWLALPDGCAQGDGHASPPSR